MIIKVSIALEWLGERECETEEDINELMQSEEFKNIGERLQIEKLLALTLNDYALLATRYPIAIQAIGLQQILIGFNLL